MPSYPKVAQFKSVDQLPPVWLNSISSCQSTRGFSLLTRDPRLLAR